MRACVRVNVVATFPKMERITAKQKSIVSGYKRKFHLITCES